MELFINLQIINIQQDEQKLFSDSIRYPNLMFGCL